MASIDPVAYLREIPPFHELPGPLFDGAAGKLDVAYHPTGTWLARVGQAPLEHLWVIRKGAVRLERNGQTLQVLEEGETFGYTSLITGKATLDVVVEDDLVAYRIPGAEFQRLLSDAHFAGHFAVGLSARLRARAWSTRPWPRFRPTSRWRWGNSCGGGRSGWTRRPPSREPPG